MKKFILLLIVAQATTCLAETKTYTPVPIRDPGLKENLCRILSSTLTREDKKVLNDRVDVVALEETFSDPAQKEDATLNRIADVMHVAREHHGQSMPSRDHSPYYRLKSMKFGVRVPGDMEHQVILTQTSHPGGIVEIKPGIFAEQPNVKWMWLAGEKVHLNPDILRANEFSKNVNVFTGAEHARRVIPPSVLQKINSFSFQDEQYRWPHDTRLSDLRELERRSPVQFTHDEPILYSIKDNNDETIGYMATLDLRERSDEENVEDLYRRHVSQGSKQIDTEIHNIYRHYAYFDADGNRIGEVLPEMPSFPAGRLVTADTRTTLKELQPHGKNNELKFITVTSNSNKEVGPLRRATPNQQSLFPELALGYQQMHSETLEGKWSSSARIGHLFDKDLPRNPEGLALRGSYSPSGNVFFLNEGHGKLFDARTGHLLKDYGRMQNSIFPSQISESAFSNDGKRIFVGYNDQFTIRDAESGNTLHRIPLQGWPEFISENPDGTILVTYRPSLSDAFVKRTVIIDPETKRVTRIPGQDNLAGTLDDKVFMIGLSGMSVLKKTGNGSNTTFHSLLHETDYIPGQRSRGTVRTNTRSVSPQGELMVSEPVGSNEFSLYDLTHGQLIPVRLSATERSSHWGGSGRTADGSYYLGYTTGQGDLRLWRKSADDVSPVKTTDIKADTVAFAPNAPFVATSESGQLSIWRLNGDSMTLLTKIPIGTKESLAELSFSADSSTVHFADKYWRRGSVSVNP